MMDGVVTKGGVGGVAAGAAAAAVGDIQVTFRPLGQASLCAMPVMVRASELAS